MFNKLKRILSGEAEDFRSESDCLREHGAG